MSPRTRLVVGFLLANIALVSVAALLLLNRPATAPQVQGVLLPEPRELPDFSLLNHNNEVFTNRDLEGRWHLVSYGFTTCPDICPTTLNQLANVSRLLRERGQTDLRHRRDTVSQLASYMPFFDPGFVGLTHLDDSENPHLPFEQGLGIVAQLVPITGPDVDPSDNEYQVNHGVTLFLINPEGKLQAIFEPDSGPFDSHMFKPETVLQDYLAIRKYLG
jgi:protein SCO1/2